MQRKLSIEEICVLFIIPTLKKSGWNSEKQISFCKDANFAYGCLNTECVLYYKPNLPIAVISITEDNTNIDAGLETAINNAKLLDIPCAFSSNGMGFAFYNSIKSPKYAITNLSLDEFPAPNELWQIYKNYKATNVLISKIKYVSKNRTTRILIGLLDVGVCLLLIIFRILDNIFSTSADKRILYLTDYIDNIKDGDFNCCHNTEDCSRNIFEENWQTINNHLYPIQPKNVWVNSNGNIRIYQNSINEFVGIDKSKTYKQYPSDYFDMLFLDIHKKETVESECYQEILNYFTDALQIAIKPLDGITKFDIVYFGEPYCMDMEKPSIYADNDCIEQDYMGDTYNQSHVYYNNKMTGQQYNFNINENPRNNEIINAKNNKNIANNKITNNTKIMARQTSFQYQIELAEDLKSYLIRLQENLASAAQKYQSKTDSLFEAGMMDEKHQVLEEYMFETTNRIKSIVEQINESDIPFVNEWIKYLEDGSLIR